MTARIHALIPAAGRGERFDADVPKQYLTLAGHTLLEHAVRALAADPRIETIFVVLSAGDAQFGRIDWSAFDGRVAPLYCGGASRRESVHAGLVAASDVIDYDDWVLVHDAARACLGVVELARLIDTCLGDPVGGILAVPVPDTLKRASAEGTIARTEAREGLWQAQTPQMFPHGLLLRALDAAARSPDAAGITDEASAVERIGLSPRLVQGAPTNLKVTWPADLALAARILAKD